MQISMVSEFSPLLIAYLAYKLHNFRQIFFFLEDFFTLKTKQSLTPFLYITKLQSLFLNVFNWYSLSARILPKFCQIW